MKTSTDKFFQVLLDRFCQTRSKVPASTWCEEHLNLNEPKIKGRFSFSGREYLREVVDAWGVLPQSLRGGKNFIFVGGTGVGKTIATVGGLCHRIGTWPMRALVVKPTSGGPAGARSFSKTRLGKTIRSTKVLADKIPQGVDRYDFSTMQMIINGSVIDLTGSNSVGQLGENRCDVVLQDEIDKYPTQSEDSKEASPIVLADERMKNVIGARAYKMSTPTLPTVGIWAHFKNTDMRRRFLPCPHCKDFVVLAWSKRFSVFEPTGNEAYVHWDTEAKVNGIWDYDRVEKSAHYVCPHCQGKIRNIHVAQMDHFGKWVATAKNPLPGEIGWHLPSLYSTSPDCAVGKLAVKFLKAKRSPEGVKGFINSDLAEPDMQQDMKVDKIGTAARQIEITQEWLNLMTVDYQQNAPYFWAMIRAWDGKDKCHGLAYRALHQWYELDELQKEFKIIPQAVAIDIGFDQAEVFKNCADIKSVNRCNLLEAQQDALPLCDGWSPMKSYGGKRLYREEETGLFLPYRLRKNVDPYAGTELAAKMQIEVIEFLNDVFEDMMENIRLGKSGLQWTIAPEVDTEEYHKHMAGKKRVYSKKDPRQYSWERIRSGYADHIHACEVMQLVLAFRLQLISFDAIQTKKKENENSTT